jgi:hypothetical protein
VAVVIVGFYTWVRPSRNDWSRLPDRLICQMQSVTRPPPALTADSVGVTHPRANVLQLVVRFAQPLPAAPSYQLTYRLANNGTAFAVLTQRPDSDDLTIRNTRSGGAEIRTDLGTHARRTAPDTVEMTLDLTQFGIEKEFVSPALTVSSQLDARPGQRMDDALQVCHG